VAVARVGGAHQRSERTTLGASVWATEASNWSRLACPLSHFVAAVSDYRTVSPEHATTTAGQGLFSFNCIHKW